MTSTDETDVERGTTSRKTGTVLKRYGPFALVAVVIVAAIVVFGGGGGGDDDETGGSGGGAAETDEDALARSGPMTPAKAELLGEEVDFGPNCDTESGRLILPTLLAPPCVQPFAADNGGATSPGVTAEEILVIWYEPNPDLDITTTALLASGGADIDPDAIRQGMENYLRLYNEVFETYGRTVKLESFVSTSNEPEGQRADAIAIADRQPFAVLANGVSESFARELADRKIICAPGCVNGYPDSTIAEMQPYVWPAGGTASQLVQLSAEMTAQLAGPGKAERAGSDELRSEDRVYGLLHYNTEDGTHTQSFEEFEAELDKQGITLATEAEFILDMSRGQEIASTLIAQFQEAGVTTVIYYGDPIMPTFFTKEATAQDYFPEWIIGPNVGLDTTYLGRLQDQRQWANAFGIAALPARGPKEQTDPIRIYEWAFGEPPPNDLVLIFEPPLRAFMTAVHLAGPELTPESFRDGLFRYPVSGGFPTNGTTSWGEHGLWPDLDYGTTDDVALLWWDPAATGPDELGTEGTGMYRYATGGDRFTLGELPLSFEDVGLFDNDSSLTVWDEIPAEALPPEHPPPQL